MNCNKNKELLLLFIIIIQIFILAYINISIEDTKALKIENTTENKNHKDIKVIVNNNESISKTQIVNNLKFENTTIIYKEGIGSIIELNVTNITDDYYELNGFTILIYDQNKNIIDTISSDLYIKINSKETIFYSLETEKNLSKNAYNLEYIVFSQTK